MRFSFIQQVVIGCLLLVHFIIPRDLIAAGFSVTIDTTPLTGINGILAFDFIDGDGLNNNTVTITNFVTDGTIGSSSASGDVTGTLDSGPINVGDADFFNELLQDITYGSFIMFNIDVTVNGSFIPFPDAFSFFLLDNSLRPFPTQDPLGADVVVVLEINSSNPTLVEYGAPGPPPPTEILYRVNAAGPALASIDGGPDWISDEGFYSGGSQVITDRTVQGLDGSVPASTPRDVFVTERFNPPDSGVLRYDFPVEADLPVEVRLYMMNGFEGTSEPGERVFDVEINGALVLDDVDLSREFGHQIGGMRAVRVTSDGSIRIIFKRDVVQAPLVNAIEIIAAQP